MVWQQWVYLAWMVLNWFVGIFLIGRPREPWTPGNYAVASVIGALCVWLVLSIPVAS